jgi:hypothetical protein
MPGPNGATFIISAGNNPASGDFQELNKLQLTSANSALTGVTKLLTAQATSASFHLLKFWVKFYQRETGSESAVSNLFCVTSTGKRIFIYQI